MRAEHPLSQSLHIVSDFVCLVYFSVSFIVVSLGNENDGIETEDVEQLVSDHSVLEYEDKSRDKTDGDVIPNGECVYRGPNEDKN